MNLVLLLVLFNKISRASLPKEAAHCIKEFLWKLLSLVGNSPSCDTMALKEAGKPPTGEGKDV